MKYSVYEDGNQWCATNQDFVNLQISIAGFGETPEKALTQLKQEENIIEDCRCDGMRYWFCNNCHTKFGRGKIPPNQVAKCPRCKAGNQCVEEREQMSIEG